jgi:hypothetical protein
VQKQRAEQVAAFLAGDEDALPVGAPITKVVLGLLRDALAGDFRSASKIADLYTVKADAVKVPGLGEGGLEERALAVLRGVAEGDVPVSTAAALLASIESLGRLHLAGELHARVTALEQRTREPERLISNEDLV